MAITTQKGQTMSKGADHPQFTEVTWADYAGSGLSRRTRDEHRELQNWMAQHDLAREMSIRGDLDFELCRLLVSAALNGMPVVVKWRSGNAAIVTETVMVNQLMAPTTNGGHMHVSKWGGGHPIYYRTIIAAGTPETIFEFDANGEHHTITHPAIGDETHTVEAAH